MRTQSPPTSSTRRPSSWLVALLGLAAYVGLVYVLTVVPLQVEVPLPDWGAGLVPPLAYGLLVLICLRRLSFLRWLTGTTVLSGAHVLLGLVTEPLAVLLESRLAGNPSPWMLPPPLPEFVGVILLLVPLRDALRAPARLGRERPSGAGRGSTDQRARRVPVRPQHTAPVERTASLGGAPPTRRGESAPMPAPEAIGRRPAPRPARRRETAVPANRPQTDVVLRIALDRIMGQLPPGTFLAPEEEVAASLSQPGHVLIPGQLIVTQLGEGVARVAWNDIADQFPSRLVGLSNAEISEHLKDGLRLPIDEVVSQLPHNLFVADSPEIEIPGLDRIPEPFRPLGGAPPDHLEPTGETSGAPPVAEPSPPAVTAATATPMAAMVPAAPATPATPMAPVEEPSVDELAISVLETLRPPEPEPGTAGRETEEPTLHISFDRVMAQIPPDAFRVPLEQVGQELRQPGCLLVRQSLVLPQLAEGLVQLSWEEVAPQFPLHQMILPEAELAQRLQRGIQLPLDEVIHQLPPELFLSGAPAADVRGLESFPAPFQPLVSDPAPEPRPAEPVVRTAATSASELETPPAVVSASEPESATVIAAGDEPEARPAVTPEESPASAGGADLAPEPVEEPEPPELPASVQPVESHARSAGFELRAPQALVEPVGRWAGPQTAVSFSVAAGPGPAEMEEARRITALLAPIAAFDVSVQPVEGVMVFAVASPRLPQETAVSVAGLLLPLLTDERAPWPIHQVTLRGPETALVLTPLNGSAGGGPILVAAAARGGSLALLEILSRRAVSPRGGGAESAATAPPPADGRGLTETPIPPRAQALAASLGAFGAVEARAFRDPTGESTMYVFLPSGRAARAAGAFGQEVHAIMRKVAGSGILFGTAVVRSGRELVVIQPEDIGPGRSSVVVAGGEATRPGLAYRQVERAAAALASA